jgi:hypothetical protein
MALFLEWFLDRRLAQEGSSGSLSSITEFHEKLRVFPVAVTGNEQAENSDKSFLFFVINP